MTSGVINKLAENSGACFSASGFKTLVTNAETDASLAERIGRRVDIPAPLFQQLLIRATDAVRYRLLSTAPPEAQSEYLDILKVSANKVGEEVAQPRDVAQALLCLLQMQRKHELDETALSNFAKAHKYEEMVVALGLLCSASLSVIEPLMRSLRNDGLLVPCKAANIGWPTVRLILQNRFARHPVSARDLEKAKTDYDRLSPLVAQRLLRFWQARTTITEQQEMSEQRAHARRLTLEAGIIERRTSSRCDRLRHSGLGAWRRLCARAKRGRHSADVSPDDK